MCLMQFKTTEKSRGRRGNRCGRTENLRTSKYTLEERKARALAFLKQNTVMRVGDYARITGLSHTKAAAELKNLCSDDSLGITSEGTYGSKVFFPENG